MGKHLDILHKLILDKEINRRERGMLIALKSFDFEHSNVISVGLQALLGYFCIKNKECIYSVLRRLQDKGYIRIEKKTGMRNVYVIIKDYLLSNDVEDSGYNDVSSDGQGRQIDETAGISGYADVSSNREGRYEDVSGSRYDDETGGISRYADVSTNGEGRYEDVPASRYVNVPSVDEGRYEDVPGSRYADETSGISGYIDVSSNREGRYEDVPSSRYIDVPSNDQGRYDNVST